MHTIADETTCMHKSFWKYLVKFEEERTLSRMKRMKDGKMFYFSPWKKQVTISYYVCLSAWNGKSEKTRQGNMQSLKEQE